MQRYNIYFAGELLEGQDPATVRDNLTKLFRADEQTLQRLFSGKLQLLKRDCDKDTAVKYQQAMKRAGARPIIRVADAIEPAPAETANHQASAGPGSPDGLDLCPEGAEVLRPAERAAVVPPSVEAPELDVAQAGERLAPAAKEAPQAPDTSHLSMGEVGEPIPNLPRKEFDLDPDTSALALSPEGTDFSDCAAPGAAAPELDLSDLELLPADSATP